MQELEKTIGVDHKRIVGLTERLAPFRSTFVDQLFVRDEGDIPSSLKLPTPPQICCRCHPGVCKKDITFRMQTAVDALKSSVQQWVPGFAFRVEAANNRSDGPRTYGNHFFLACATPFVVLAQQVGDGDLDYIDYQSVESAVLDIFKNVDPLTLTFVCGSDVPPRDMYDACDLFRHGEVQRLQFWDSETHNKPASSGLRQKAQPVHISELDSLIKKMRDSLRGIPEGDFDRDEDEAAIDALDFGKSALSKLKRQAGKRRKASTGCQLTKNVKSKKKATVELQQKQQEPQHKVSAVFVAPKNSRRVEIGGRTFYELHPGGVFTCYCLICEHRHTDKSGKGAGVACCKSATFGDKRPFSLEEARKRLLLWEAAGSQLSGASPRTDHVQMGGQLLNWYAS